MKREEKIPQSTALPRRGRWTRALALTLAFALLIPSSGLAFADDVAPAEPELCVHHPEHDENCGYVEAAEGSPCTHEHDEICGYSAPTEGVPCAHEHDGACGYVEAVESVACDMDCTETDESGSIVHSPDCAYTPAVEGSSCTHEHDENCGYIAPSAGTPCNHEHNEDCGYVAPVEGAPCGFLCDKCITGWQWDDPDELLTWNEAENLWGLGLPGAGEEDPVTRDVLSALLPQTLTAQTAAGEQAVALSWDLDALPEEGAYEETYTLTAAPDGDEYVLTDTAPELKVLLELGGAETYAVYAALALNDWTWEGLKKQGTEAVVAINVENISTAEELATALKGVLPNRIYGSSSGNSKVTNDGPYTYSGKYDTSVSPSRTWGYLEIDWTKLGDQITAGIANGSIALGQKGEFTVTADKPTWPGTTYYINDGWGEPNRDTFPITVRTMVRTGYSDQTPPTQVTAIPGKHKFVNNWSYVVPESGIGIINNGSNEAFEYYATVDLDPTSYTDIDALVEKVKEGLPKKILCTGSYDQTLIDAGFTCKDNSATSGSSVEGYVNITWVLADSATSRVTPELKNGMQLTFYAEPESKPGFLLRVNSNNPGYLDTSGTDRADTAEAYDILNLTVTVTDMDSVWKAHTVTPANPQNVTVNLFDYWVEDYGQNPTSDKSNGNPNGGDILMKTDWHKNTATPPTGVARTGVKDWDKGINVGRLLLFGDGLIHAGLWNKGAGAITGYGANHAGMQDLVLRVLQDGYPVVNDALHAQQFDDHQEITDYELSGEHLPGNNDPAKDSSNPAEHSSTEPKNISNIVYDMWNRDPSLAYLFDPKVTHVNKASYENITGLFQLDNQGYYYYDMRQNFAEFSGAEGDNNGNNHFILYDAAATVRTDGVDSIGNFFPFNTAAQVFNGLDSNGKLSSTVACSGNEMNHHLGMTVQVDFRQPANGTINSGSNAKPMTFQFSGDDDVWVFIDDVLVLDMGGIHSEVYGIIDFATGDVYVGRSYNTNGIPTYTSGTEPANCVTSTNLLAQYNAAQKTDATKWNGNTFASNTSHTLKMFYLERGNYDSSLALRFNLQPLLYQQIRKVDQNGNAVEGVEFSLYPAAKTTENTPGAIECLYTDDSSIGKEAFYVTQTATVDNKPLVTLKTEADGSARFKMDDGSYFNFADEGDAYYILRETTAPSGYRKQPVDIVLHYDKTTSMLSVANRWTTGAYACSVAHVTGPVDVRHKDGLVVAVPLLRKSDGKWHPLYGNNISGFQMLSENDILLAALEQIKGGYADWHLSWDDANSRLYGTLSDLPGLASRYTLVAGDEKGDIKVAYVQISADALSALGVSGADADARYKSLYEELKSADLSTVDVSFTTLTADTFNREFRSLIYIPNERRELRVMKIDESGRPLEGAVFTLYSDKDCTTEAAHGTTDENGMLVFSPTGTNGKTGEANMVWADSTNTHYYLQETAAPAGCKLNNTVIPVVVGIYSIYADAGEANDGVSVMASVGRLTQTMHQYARANDVDITLQDITAFMQTQASGSFSLTGWQDAELADTNVKRSMNLHYGLNNEDGKLVDYGLHDEDGGAQYKPFFVTDTGFIRTRVQQMAEGDKTRYTASSTHQNASWEDLSGIDLTNLFSMLNVVVVTDKQDPEPAEKTAQLTISKKVEGTGLSDECYTRLYSFKVELKGADGTALDGKFEYNFYGKDKWGYVSNGDTLLLHHDESVTILGLPEGTRFTVREIDPVSGWYVKPGQSISGTASAESPGTAEFTNTRDPDKPDPTPSPEPSPSPDPSPSPKPSPSPDPSPSPKPSPSPEPSPSPSPTPSPEPSPSPSPEPSPSPSPSPSPDPVPSPTDPTPPVDPGDPSQPPTPEYPTQLPDPNSPDAPDRVIVLVDDTPVPFVRWWDPESEEWVYIPEEDLPLIGMDPYPTPEPGYIPGPYLEPGPVAYPELVPEQSPVPSPAPESSPGPTSGVPATGDWNILWLAAFGLSLLGLIVTRKLRGKEHEDG